MKALWIECYKVLALTLVSWALHCTHLLLADESQTNLYAFHGSISDSIFVPVLVCMLAECNWSVCVCDINKLLPVEFLLLEVGGKVVEARPRVDPRKFASSLVWFGWCMSICCQGERSFWLVQYKVISVVAKVMKLISHKINNKYKKLGKKPEVYNWLWHFHGLKKWNWFKV